jgi:putative ABC transport system ATP-binding protein
MESVMTGIRNQEPREDGGDTPLIRVSKLEKSFPQGPGRYYVLRDLSLALQPGEFVSIMGPSGAGKSTLLAILGMHDGDWSGEYWFDGEPVHRLNAKARGELRNRNIGFVFQSYHLIDDLTVYENIEIPLSYRNVPKSRRASIVCDALDRFQIVAKRDLYPRQLSGGQQQLVAIARALVASPKLVLADEPTGNLHSDQGREIMERFRALNQEGVTIVQVTHSDVNAAYGGRIIRLKDGWIEGEERTGQPPPADREATR